MNNCDLFIYSNVSFYLNMVDKLRKKLLGFLLFLFLPPYLCKENGYCKKKKYKPTFLI